MSRKPRGNHWPRLCPLFSASSLTIAQSPIYLWLGYKRSCSLNCNEWQEVPVRVNSPTIRSHSCNKNFQTCW
ncbi:hypothetical protein F4679DRAFT_540948 [Xylaria curta]|nr:hypothetical protein F4679DRAFT_540948 [Xylaria curta]